MTVFVWLLIFTGLVGTIVPMLPGVGLVFFGILLHALYFGVETVGMTTLILLGIVTALSFVFDLLASLYGAARFGASRRGVVSSVVGGVVGFVVFNIPGLFLGLFIGAIVGELFLAQKSFSQAFTVGMGSVLGFLGGAIIKLLLALIMVIVFAAKIWF